MRFSDNETHFGETHFGFETVRIEKKQAAVDEVFHKVANRYDLMNDLMSGGMHRLWKNALVGKVHPRDNHDYLDVAGGTGDIAFRIANQGGHNTRVTLLDINPDMLATGKQRAKKRYLIDQLTFVEGNAEALPLPDSHFDVYTIAFGIRNVPRIDLALREAYRVLRRGGRFLCLEFSHIDVPLLDKVYDKFSFGVIPPLGKIVAGDSQPYRYLVESIRCFPQPEIFAEMIAEAGFARSSFERLSGGIVAIHSGWKL